MRHAYRPENRTYLKNRLKRDSEDGELYEAEEVLGIVFRTDEDAALPTLSKPATCGLAMRARRKAPLTFCRRFSAVAPGKVQGGRMMI
jgi:hypothetical protein